MNKKDIIIAVLVLLLLFVLGYLVISQAEDPEVEDVDQEEIVDEDFNDEDPEVEDEEEDEEDIEEPLRDIVLDFLGSPHHSDPLDDDENIYRDDAFNSTTLVLISAAKFNSPDNPEEAMRELHYYPPGEVSYENRLHFSTYRNKVSDYFRDITVEVGGDSVDSKDVILNKEDDGDRLIDMDWEEEITLEFVRVEDFSGIISDLPEVAGITFIMDGDEDIGLDVRREGILIDGYRFIHACSEEGEVIEEDILDFLDDNDYDAVNLFEFNE